MNAAGQIGGGVMSFGYGALVDSYGWDLPFGRICCSSFVSILLWLKVCASKPVVQASNWLLPGQREGT